MTFTGPRYGNLQALTNRGLGSGSSPTPTSGGFTRGGPLSSFGARGLGAGSVGFEGVVRGFVDIDSQPINRIFRRPDPPLDTPEAQIIWGASSNFIFPPQAVPGDDGTSGTGGVRIIWPDENEGVPEDELPVPVARVLTEVSRRTSDRRVENPDDPAQYVIIRRIDSLIMSDNITGETMTWVFTNPP